MWNFDQNHQYRVNFIGFFEILHNRYYMANARVDGGFSTGSQQEYLRNLELTGKNFKPSELAGLDVRSDGLVKAGFSDGVNYGGAFLNWRVAKATKTDDSSWTWGEADTTSAVDFCGKASSLAGWRQIWQSFESRFQTPKFEFSDLDNPKTLIFVSKSVIFLRQKILVLHYLGCNNITLVNIGGAGGSPGGGYNMNTVFEKKNDANIIKFASKICFFCKIF